MEDRAAAKKEARARVRARRREVVDGQGPEGRRAQAAGLAEAFLTWAREYAAGLGRADLTGLTVTAFDPMATEPPVDELVRAAQDAGLRVLLPVTVREGRRLHWVLASAPDGTEWGPDALGDVDIALIPGLAVDRTGHRLGQGGGYYDRALPLVRPGVPVIVALHDHELPDGTPAGPEGVVPHGPHDIPVDAVLTTAGVTRLR
ncbi:5-formyltetrahydrofolate cyclo-ligase [Ornithinimicrobium cavernae]|uniref:5-formyltetrahydrofolate cyclo-ligase n=1 Tax=Ornithinimicrobium cavernae TaxID=2666047 RepID=UPI00137AB9A1|nr:5-formyltetrahydrofolate cyclo-ligase [Ornithinimicrobium cavernae]